MIEHRDVVLERNLGDTTEVVSGIGVADQVVLAPNALPDTSSRVTARTVIAEVAY